ncbi:MAG: hypothetical protein RLZZ519_3134, partial [Bacteroidota bacterium]
MDAKLGNLGLRICGFAEMRKCEGLGSVSQSVSELPLLGVGEVGPCASLCASSAPNKDPRREGDVI